MNQLSGNIIDIRTEGHLSLLHIDVAGTMMKSVIIETPASAPYLHKGANITVCFKETELVLAKALKGVISIQNRLDCSVSKIDNDTLLSKIYLNYKSSPLVSIITRDAVDQLNLQAGDKVTAMIKTNEVTIAP